MGIHTIDNTSIGFIYLIVIRETFEQYVGQTRVSIGERIRQHLCGNLLVNKKMCKYGYDVYEIEQCTIDDLNDREEYYIDLFNTLRDRKCGGLNLTTGGAQYKHLSDESRQRMSVGQRRRYTNPEERQKTGQKIREYWSTHESSFKGKHHTEEAKQKNSQKKKQYYIEHPEALQKMSQRMKEYCKIHGTPTQGKHHSEETKKKISQHHIEYYKTHKPSFKGKHHTDETKKKISQHHIEYYKNHDNPLRGCYHPNPMQGKHHSEETKRKISQHHRRLYSEHPEVKQRISQSLKEYFKNNDNPMQGKHHNEKTKEKISQRLNEYHERRLQAYLDWEWEQTQIKPCSCEE